MSQSGACCTLWLVPITFELSLSAYYACNALWFCRTGFFHGSVGAILFVRTDGILRIELWLPREIVEVAIIVVDGVGGHVGR